MQVDDLSGKEVEAVGRILQYWTQHWDFECPTLFGLELPEVQSVAEAWPRSASPEVTALAVLGAMREFLYGASATPKERVLSEVGITFEMASALLDHLFPRIEADLGRSGDAV